MRLLILAALAATLAACASPAPPPEFHLQANLAAPCPPLPALKDGSRKESVSWIWNAATLYHDCADRHASAVRAISRQK